MEAYYHHLEVSLHLTTLQTPSTPTHRVQRTIYMFANKYLNPAHISSPLGKICAAGRTNP